MAGKAHGERRPCSYMADPSTAGELTDVERLRFDNQWLEFVSTQCANFVRANAVDEDGLSKPAVLSVAVEMNQSTLFQQQREVARPWCDITSPDFVTNVDAGFYQLKNGGKTI